MREQEPVVLPSREAFIRRSNHAELVWMMPEVYGLAWDYNPTRRVEIGPWSCSCGFQCRDAGRMWDHAQEHREGGVG